ncbi:MAG: methionine--tRNA ligase [Candidatus Hydrothermarchaeota archaeon]|nr:methionine--tRNA ligase [Candidatus Hydrothermarchaeota archaeon]
MPVSKLEMVIATKQKILITCALPYVNNVPHIGNIAGSHLPSDIFARFCRLAGCETVFIGGSDEHGTPIEVAAQKLGIKPKELCERYYAVHKEIYDWLDISYDNFYRTSLPEHHETTKDFFKKIYENGFVSEGALKLPFCEKCSRVLPDRFVEGTCPKCGFEEARGDQCEHCSTLLNPDELKYPRCVICGSKPTFKEIKHLFLNLDQLQHKLEKWIKSIEKIWSAHVVSAALGWINEGLKPRCITRDIKWGVKVPLKGYEDKVFYVWFDAPIGYISSTKEWAKKIGKPDEWKKFWQSKDAKIFHFIGKDNIPFHTIFWPGMLLANGEYVLPYRVAGLQYLNYEGDKISKSHGRGIFCENLASTGLSSDLWRYYLTLLIPETDDTEWKWKEFKERVNNELVANFGNFVYRTLSFIQNNFNGEVPKAKLSAGDREVLKLSRKYAAEIKDLIWGVRLRDALRKVFELSDQCNRYFQKSEPWKAIKEDKEKAAAALYVCANLCYYLAILISPFLPKSARKICEQLGANLGTLEDVGKEKINSSAKIKNAAPLFPKLDEKTIERLKKTTSKVTQYEELFKKEAT